MNHFRSLLIVLALSTTAVSHGATFQRLGNQFELQGLSGDGSTVYGKQGGVVVRWELSESPELLTSLPAPLGLIRPYGISYDGSHIVGEYLYRQYDRVIPPFNDIQTVSLYEAFVYSSDTQAIDTLGFLDQSMVADDTATARDISADGSVIVGGASSANGPVAFRWTRDGGMHPLGHPTELSGKSLRSVTSVSGDGNIAVGSVVSDFGSPPPASPVAMWTAEGGTHLLDNPDGSYVNVLPGVNRVSSDGSTVIGDRSRLTFSLPQAWRWTEATGAVYLDVEAIHDSIFGSGPRYGSSAVDVSADGAIIVGSLTRPDKSGAMIWDEANGACFLDDYLSSKGLDLDGWSLSYVIAMSDNGQTFLGRGINPAGIQEYWLANASPLSGDYNDDGKIDAADYVVWRKGLGTTHTHDDYPVWRAQFGQNLSSGSGTNANAAVPEPATLLLILTVGITATCSRQRDRLVN